MKDESEGLKASIFLLIPHPSSLIPKKEYVSCRKKTDYDTGRRERND